MNRATSAYSWSVTSLKWRALYRRHTMQTDLIQGMGNSIMDNVLPESQSIWNHSARCGADQISWEKYLGILYHRRQHVPLSVHRADKRHARSRRIDFAAQAGDVCIDCAVGNGRGIAVKPIHDGLA